MINDTLYSNSLCFLLWGRGKKKHIKHKHGILATRLSIMPGFAGKPDLNIHLMVSVTWKENKFLFL